MAKSCASCCFKDPNAEKCLLFNIKVDSSKYICGAHQFSAYNCALCGRLMRNGGFIVDDGLVCPNCAPAATYSSFKEIE